MPVDVFLCRDCHDPKCPRLTPVGEHTYHGRGVCAYCGKKDEAGYLCTRTAPGINP
jgi:hypothetical protein